MRKKMFATLRNCSSRFLGRKVMTLYFEVRTWLLGYCQRLSACLPILRSTSLSGVCPSLSCFCPLEVGAHASFGSGKLT